jgi:aspartyl-tRNA(Asn)/glutamyl-tRNA(Gln) amidotransferase subunit A
MDCVMEPNFLSIHEAVQLLEDGKIPPHALTEACFRQIERLNPTLNAFITVCDEVIAGPVPSEARELAKGATGRGLDMSEKTSRPTRPPALAMTLKNIPIAVKDLFETKGIRTTAGSKFFADYVPTQDAVAVQKLKEAGAVILGKTNTHEIALGVTSNNPHFGACRNPWDTQRIPGGSSGGSAVAVASGMALAALGTDTGGSIRIPAALCGVVGLKPTYGRVSLRGVFPLSWNLDHVGPLTRTVKDAALLLQIIAGYDSEDPACANVPVDDYLSHIENGIKGQRVALAVGDYIENSDREVLEAVTEAAKIFEKLGARVEKVEMSLLREAALANGVITQADGAAFHRERLAEHPDWFGADVRQRLEIGRNFTSTEYSLARRTQVEMKHHLGKLFERYDFLLLPTTPIPAPLIEGGDAIEQARRLTRFTAPFNLTGLPAVSLPCGLSREGLPIGLQVVALWWAEAELLRAGQAFTRATKWNERRPALSQA